MGIEDLKMAKKLGKIYVYAYSEIKNLQDDCKLTDEQLEKIIRIAHKGKCSLSSISDALIGFR